MATKEHVAILNLGIEAWNKWREENPVINPDLTLLDLNRSIINKANSQKSIERFKNLDLGRINFSNTILNNAFLSDVSLDRANLSQASVTGANLIGTNLTSGILRGTDFSRANLTRANLTRAIMRKANFQKADLTGANLSHSLLTHADFTGVTIGSTVFADLDLSQVIGLDSVKHAGPSAIGIDTIYQSGGRIPEVFLRGAGVPNDFITFMKSLTAQAFDFYSCFISHSSKDREFVERLYADLQSNGVRCWYAPEDLKIGEPFLLGIDQGIRLHDKLLLILSEESVNSGWVQHEVLSAMSKEQGQEPWVLFPIRLDAAVMETTVPWATLIRDSRHIANFTQWKDHDSYRKSFDRLLRDLQGKS